MFQDRNFHDGIRDAELEELDALQPRRAGNFTDAQRETSGIFVLVDHNGSLKIEGAYRERETSEKETSSHGPGNNAAPAKPDLTQSGKEDLHRIALLALQTAMIEKTELLLDLDQDDEPRATFTKLKKGQKAKELEGLFADASVQEALGLSRAQIAKIDAWLPPEIRATEVQNR